MTPNRLYQLLVTYLDEGELQTLCFELGVDYESLPAVGKANKSRELLLLLARQKRINDLLEYLAHIRPNVAWPSLSEAVALTEIIPAELTAVSPPPQPSLNIGGNVTGPVSRGDMTINAPIAGGNLTINPETPRWQRWSLLALLVLMLVVVGGVGMLIRPLFTPRAHAPEIDQFLPVVATVAPRLHVTAMTLAHSEDREVLWFGAWQDEQAGLYRLDVTAQETAVPHLSLSVNAEINLIMVDCRQNVWLVLNEIGIMVYQPATGRQETLLNKTTLPDWMAYNTITALAHRCTEMGEVEVWLGRAGIQTAHYSSDYPTLETLVLTPRDTDPTFLASRELEITALLYAPETAVLWATGRAGELLSISIRQIRQPQLTRYEDDTLWSLGAGKDGTIWAGGSRHLIHDGNLLTLRDEAGFIPDSRARFITAEARWVWFGDTCPQSVTNCWTLAAYQNGRFFPIDLGTRYQVTGLATDTSGAVWIGTENGLIMYPNI